MLSQYVEWIKKYLANSFGMGTCKETTERMQLAFPELERVRGHYYCPIWGEREHWWLVDSESQIIDPTKDQFPSKGQGVYTAWIEGTEEPTGKCLNCGEYTYGDASSICSERCDVEFRASLI